MIAVGLVDRGRGRRVRCRVPGVAAECVSPCPRVVVVSHGHGLGRAVIGMGHRHARVVAGMVVRRRHRVAAVVHRRGSGMVGMRARRGRIVVCGDARRAHRTIGLAMGPDEFGMTLFEFGRRHPRAVGRIRDGGTVMTDVVSAAMA